MSKMNKFEIELPVVPKPAKLSLSERDIAVATMYVCVFVCGLGRCIDACVVVACVSLSSNLSCSSLLRPVMASCM